MSDFQSAFTETQIPVVDLLPVHDRVFVIAAPISLESSEPVTCLSGVGVCNFCNDFDKFGNFVLVVV